MKDQILKIIDAEGLTPARFADEIGVQRSSISHLISGRNKPSYDFIIKILNRFSGINAEWLITGKGSMIKSSEAPNYTQNSIFDKQKTTTQEQVPDNISNTNQNTLEPTQISAQLYDKKNSQTAQSDKMAKGINSEVTNVNDVDFMLIFYKDGTFKRYKSRD